MDQIEQNLEINNHDQWSRRLFNTNKRTFGILVIFLLIGLIIGSIFSATITNIVQKNDEKEDTINIIDTDNDGVSDNDEILEFDSNPNDPDDMLVRTGLLILYHSGDDQILGTEKDISVLISQNDRNASEILHISSSNRSTRIVWGEFTLKKVDDEWEIVKENTSGYDDINVNIQLESSLSIVMKDLSVGYGVVENIMWISFEEYPTLFTNVELKGVQIDLDLLEDMGIYFGLNIDEYIGIFEGLFDNTIDDFQLILVEEISYPDSITVKGDIVHQINPSSSSQFEYSWTEENFGYSLMFLEESSEDGENWALFAPEYWIYDRMTSVVTIEQVAPMLDDDPFLDSMISSDIPFDIPEMNLKYGIVTSSNIQTEKYIPSTVSSFHTQIETEKQVPVSVECYVLWTSAQDIIDVMSEEGADSDLLESILVPLGLEDAAIGLMMDMEMGDEIKLETISWSIGIAVSSGIDPDETSLMIGTMEGVLHQIPIDPDTEKNIPLLVVDTFEQYDTIVETTINEIDEAPSDYSISTDNKVMVELEGHVIGTTVKTLIDRMDDIPELSFLKIIQYLPHDICVYQFIQVDDSDNELYSIPIIQVVAGKGKTYFGERMKVQGWFSNELIDDSLSELVEESLDDIELSEHLKQFMISILNHDTDGINLTTFLQDWFRVELHDSMISYISDLEEQILFDIDDMEINDVSISEMVNDHLSEFQETVDSNLVSLGLKLDSAMKNITSDLDLISNSNQLISDIQSNVNTILQNDLTFDDVSSLIQDVEDDLDYLDGFIEDIEAMSTAHISNLNNITSQLLSINSSCSSLSNGITGLYKNIADQLKKTMENAINSIGVDVIVDIIMAPFGSFPLLPPPAAPPGYSTFESFLNEKITEGINVIESIFFSKLDLDYESFWEYVNNSSEFDFLDDIFNLSKDILKNITSSIATLKGIVNQYQSDIEKEIQNLRDNYEDMAGHVDHIEYLIEDLDENRDLIDGHVKGLETLLNGMANDIARIKENIIQEKEFLSGEITNIDLMINSLSLTMKNDMETDFNDLFQNFIEKFINDIKNATKESIDLVIDDPSHMDQYFQDIYSCYVEDVLSFIDTSIWDLLATADRSQVGGHIIVYLMYF